MPVGSSVTTENKQGLQTQAELNAVSGIEIVGRNARDDARVSYVGGHTLTQGERQESQHDVEHEEEEGFISLHTHSEFLQGLLAQSEETVVNLSAPALYEAPKSITPALYEAPKLITPALYEVTVDPSDAASVDEQVIPSRPERSEKSKEFRSSFRS